MCIYHLQKEKKIKDHNLKEETFKENTISLISHTKKNIGLRLFKNV